MAESYPKTAVEDNCFDFFPHLWAIISYAGLEYAESCVEALLQNVAAMSSMLFIVAGTAPQTTVLDIQVPFYTWHSNTLSK